ncbi:MAG TPA: SLC13 family permease [Myxococcota bacterium]|jgi:sodium-dependent dicarboxylate transporter 2/3/5|nr:SLC13 family permease [Myxococcota bacterium]
MPRGSWKRAALLAGPLAFAALLVLDTPLRHWGEYGARPAIAAGLTLWMALWWISEALPIHWTACLPLLVLPFAGIHGEGFGTGAAGALLPYLNPYIFLFLGGMGIAAAMQQRQLDRRIALAILHAVGTDPRRLLLGVLIATASISLWISNTATAAMMFPIGLALIGEFERQVGKRLAHYGAAIMLAVAYASNIGGIGTKIGTVPSAQLSGFLAQRGVEISFFQFMAIGIPFVALMLPIVWLALWRVGRPDAPDAGVGRATLEQQSALLGPMKRGEQIVLGVFVATAALWIVAKPIGDWLKAQGFPGLATAHVEAGVALGASAVLALWRVDGHPVLALRSLRTLQWSVLVVLGGGFSLAAAIETSGLSQWLGAQLALLRDQPTLAQAVVASLVTVTLSAFASNAATVAVMLPVLAGSVAPENVEAVLFAATFAASCDFALPAGTPPNAIVFGSGYISIPLMVRTGVRLDLLAALLAALWCWIAVPWVL